MFSHCWCGGDCGIEEQGQASPSGVPPMTVRVAGQILESPSVRTDHSVGKGTTGTEEACVLGWEIR